MAWPWVGPSSRVRRINRSRVPCSSSMRSARSLVDILGERTHLPLECQGGHRSLGDSRRARPEARAGISRRASRCPARRNELSRRDGFLFVGQPYPTGLREGCLLAEQNRRLAGNVSPGVAHDSEPAIGKTAKVQEPGGPYAVQKASERFFRATNACRSRLDNRRSKDCRAPTTRNRVREYLPPPCRACQLPNGLSACN